MDEDLLLWLLAGGGGLLLLLAVTGFFVPAGGTYRDGDRSLTLEQLGPRIWGRGERPGGYETYAGWAYLGRAVIRRRAHGKDLLTSLGFDSAMVSRINGIETARFVMRADSSGLIGTFQGRRFRIEGSLPRLAGSTLDPPLDRVWLRRG